MPELPEVEAIRRRLEPYIVGQRIVSFTWILPRILREGDSNALIGSTIKGFHRRGKHLIIETDRPIAIFVHLRMTGTLLWGSASLEDCFLRARIQLESGEVFYRDIRTLGGFWIRALESPPWKTLALDPLETGFTTSYLTDRLVGKKIAIKQALLDQAVVSGIGNIYASEVLFRSGVHPLQPSCHLSAREVERIVFLSRQVLEEAIASNGTTFRDFRLSDGREGSFQDFLKVYGKANQPCSKCGTLIKRITQGQRSSFFCPQCQKLSHRPR